MNTAEEYAQEYYQLDKSGITSVTVTSAINFAQRYQEYASQFKTVEPEMAEEEMYIVASRLELEKMMLGKTAIWDSNPYKKCENLSHARVFKLIEVTE